MTAWHMPCLTVRQPTGWLLQQGIQTFINRRFKPPHKVLSMGRPFVLHVAGAGVDIGRIDYIDRNLEARGYPQRVPNQLPLGVVIGIFRFQGATEGFRNDPFRGNEPWAWVVKPVVQLVRPMSAKGDKGLWYLPADLYSHLLTCVPNTIRQELNAINAPAARRPRKNEPRSQTA